MLPLTMEKQCTKKALHKNANVFDMLRFEHVFQNAFRTSSCSPRLSQSEESFWSSESSIERGQQGTFQSSHEMHFMVELIDYRIFCINKNRSGANVIMLRPQPVLAVTVSAAANDTPKCTAMMPQA